MNKPAFGVYKLYNSITADVNIDSQREKQYTTIHSIIKLLDMPSTITRTDFRVESNASSNNLVHIYGLKCNCCGNPVDISWNGFKLGYIEEGRE